MANRYTLIRGQFPIVGTQPDGDTLRFEPEQVALVAALGPDGQRPAWSQEGTQVNTRFEAIDALETHFKGEHQQVELGQAALEQMLRLAGFTSVSHRGLTVSAATPQAVPGWVAANTLDSYGRMVAFVFTGEAPGADGSAVYLTPELLARSLNVQLLSLGLVYPAFYTTLPTDLKDHLAAAVRVIRDQGLGLWPMDAPSLVRAAEVPDLAATRQLVMWPKLFRRLVAYFQACGDAAGLTGFEAWLREDKKQRDDYLLLPTGEFGNMHDLLQISGNSLRLRYRPEDLVVLPDTFVPGPSPAPEPAPSAAGTGLRIVAALPNPDGPESGPETVTLINTGRQALDLSGWQLRDRQLQAAQKPGQWLSGSLGAGEALRLRLGHPLALANTGDELWLLDGTGQVVDQHSYQRVDAKPGVTCLFTPQSPTR